MKYRLIFLLAILMLLPGLQAGADEVRELSWDDLIPAELDFDDPFEKLTDAQLYNLGTVALYREKQASKEEITDPSKDYYEEAMAELKADNIDIDGLLAIREEITEKRRARGQKANAELNGENIRIPGYLLPLEFEDRKVVEFLLVPWVGACIHTPPPPANQLVHVRYPQGVEFEGLYAPVWVKGRIEVQRSVQGVRYVDGDASVETSYFMQPALVKPYR